MNKEELMNEMNKLTDEQKADITTWLQRGEGHSVAPIEHFTNMGIPLEFLEPMVNRTWSNFVQIPKGVVKVANDCITERPIGFVDGEKYDSTGNAHRGWKLLLTPREQEKGYLETDSYYGITKSRAQRIFIENVEEDEYEYPEEVWDEYVKTHNLHPKASYWSHHWEQCGNWEDDKGTLTIEYTIPVCPDVDKYNDNEPREHEISEQWHHYLIKYEGTKRVDYININRLQWHQHHASKKPLTKKAAMEWVREKLAQNDERSGRLCFVGDINFQTKDGKQRPMKDIAQDKWQDSVDNIAWHKESIERQTARCSDILVYMELVAKHPDWNLHEITTPKGWIHEKLEPLGYMDVMWNNNFMVPWVDGIPSSRVISAIKSTLGIEKSSTSLGRGSAARENGGFVLSYLEEEGVLAQ